MDNEAAFCIPRLELKLFLIGDYRGTPTRAVFMSVFHLTPFERRTNYQIGFLGRRPWLKARYVDKRPQVIPLSVSRVRRVFWGLYSAFDVNTS